MSTGIPCCKDFTIFIVDCSYTTNPNGLIWIPEAQVGTGSSSASGSGLTGSFSGSTGEATGIGWGLTTGLCNNTESDINIQFNFSGIVWGWFSGFGIGQGIGGVQFIDVAAQQPPVPNQTFNDNYTITIPFLNKLTWTWWFAFFGANGAQVPPQGLSVSGAFSGTII